MGYATAHNILHITTSALAAGLFAVSWASYSRTRRKRFLYIMAAFLVFSIKEIILAANIISWGSEAVQITTHVLNLVVLSLFAAGILK